jgi:hypothetical protein
MFSDRYTQCGGAQESGVWKLGRRSWLSHAWLCHGVSWSTAGPPLGKYGFGRDDPQRVTIDTAFCLGRQPREVAWMRGWWSLFASWCFTVLQGLCGVGSECVRH